MPENDDGKTKFEPNEADETPGGLPQEKVEDRPSIGTVKPEDYPEEQRRSSLP